MSHKDFKQCVHEVKSYPHAPVEVVVLVWTVMVFCGHKGLPHLNLQKAYHELDLQKIGRAEGSLPTFLQHLWDTLRNSIHGMSVYEHDLLHETHEKHESFDMLMKNCDLSAERDEMQDNVKIWWDISHKVTAEDALFCGKVAGLLWYWLSVSCELWCLSRRAEALRAHQAR